MIRYAATNIFIDDTISVTLLTFHLLNTVERRWIDLQKNQEHRKFFETIWGKYNPCIDENLASTQLSLILFVD